MKFYAVKRGLTPGIYTSWDECKANVIGFPGAEYKSFKSEAEAKQYISGNASLTPETKEVKSNKKKKQEIAATRDYSGGEGPFAFVDGSFNEKTEVYGFGGFLVSGSDKHVLQGSGSDPEMASMRNVAGEVLGSMAAVKKAQELGLTSPTIYYDYWGIEFWATDEWKRNKKGTKEYYEFMVEAMKTIDIKFLYAPSHSGIEGNEEADRLAKQAVGIE